MDNYFELDEYTVESWFWKVKVEIGENNKLKCGFGIAIENNNK